MKLFKRVKDGRKREIWILGRLVYSYTSKPVGHKANIHGNNPNVPTIVSKGLKLSVFGAGNVVEIDPSSSFAGSITIGTRDCPVKNCRVKIEANVLANSCEVFLLEDDSEVVIGEDSLISTGVKIWCTDSHSILDKEGVLLNRGKFVHIGKHVWLGMDVHIGKNLEIADDIVVGMGSIVTKSLTETRSVYVGSPAKQVKSEVIWSKARPNNYNLGIK